MPCTDLIQVSLDNDLVHKILDGLYSGARGRALKVVIDAEGRYHINSKGLTIVVEAVAGATEVSAIHVSNEKQYAHISRQQLAGLGLEHRADSACALLKEKYSPHFHSLADNIVVFSRAYHGEE